MKILSCVYWIDKKVLSRLTSLGMKEDTLNTLKVMVARPQGIILVTGPTGSGKTTTLYSVLNYLNSESVNIMTLEDPVEYPTTMIRQASVQESGRLDFSSGIRSIMRQDPDIILVGEIRDEDTANMAFRAAMTGHQVFSTLHTNSAIGSIPRLTDIGIKPDIMAGNIIGVIAQRLVRKLCDRCKEPYQLTNTERNLLGMRAADKQQVIYKAKGCPRCDGTGFKGRMSLLEILRFDDDIDELVARGGTQGEILRMAVSKGFRTLADVGSSRVLDGSTSLDEITRVVDLTKRFEAEIRHGLV